MNTLADLWAKFDTEVVPRDAPLIQRIEMRRAFYAGAVSFQHLIKVIGEASTSEAAGMAMLEGLDDELKRFNREIQAGRA